MDWFLALDAPVQTALVALPVSFLGAIGGIIALIYKSPSPPKGSTHMEIAGVMMDRDTIKHLSTNIEKLVASLSEGVKWRERQTRSIELLTDELKDVRQELRYIGQQKRRGDP